MPAPSKDEVISYFDSLSNWGRWGEDDERGTLNFITPEKRVQAASLVREGAIVSCSRQISKESTAIEASDPFMHFMKSSGEGAAEHGRGSAADWVGLDFHGSSITHLDALSHYFWNHKTYNGRSADVVSTAGGAEFASVESAREGIVSRGVLLDIPRSEGIPFVEPGEAISPEMLDRCAENQKSPVGSGDVVLVRTGRDACDRWSRAARAGLQADCLKWLHGHEVSMLVSDSTHDISPKVYGETISPIHNVSIVALGLWLLDNAYFEDLAAKCASSSRWEFQFVVGPLVLHNTTGSPVNPIAIF